MSAVSDTQIAEALADLERIGRHWLPDPGSDEVHMAVKAKLPNRTILHLEPEPWDEHVLCDADKGYLSEGDLARIAKRRLGLRDQGVTVGLPE